MASRNRGSIYSFGDGGVTASVSAFGRLLRVSRHFSGQDFGYCVDHPSIPQPYFILERITSLHSMISDSGKSLGIDPKVDILDTGHELSVEFMHDRWPHFTVQGSNCGIKIQLFASGGTIYQSYEFDFVNGSDIRPPKLVTMANLLIRQLDFIDSANIFNDAGMRDAGYETRLSGDNTCIRRSHHSDEGEVVLFIFAYCKGELLAFQHAEDKQVDEEDDEGASADESQEEQKEHNGSFEILWGEKTLEDLLTTKTMKVTFAYRLEFFPKRDERDEHISPINTEVIGTAVQQVEKYPFDEHRFTAQGTINQVLRRNLEHILSVCSIPVIAGNDKSQEPAIALTCGDVDGHRVATAASFFCFEFLLLALDYFESLPRPHTYYSDWMTERILKTCNGHLKWLFGKEYRNLAKYPFAPHCWVSGKVIDGRDKNTYLPSTSLVEVPFQIIKAGDFYARHKEWGVPQETEAVVEAWIQELDQRNKLGRYVFPCYSNEPVHSFYFTDHVYIWRAIKSAEDMGLKSKLRAFIDRKGEGRQFTRNYSSIQFQEAFLKRFTTENRISKKRMIAVYKSVTHNRFLLRNKDTGLFHAMDLGLFDKSRGEEGQGVWQNKIDMLENLVDCQSDHMDNSDTSWDEPLRFALSFAMAQTGKPMNLRPVEEMRSHALSVLLKSAWPSGLFPGQLGANKEPTLYDYEIMRDTYWSSSFEIPYILWKYSRPPFPFKTEFQARGKDGVKIEKIAPSGPEIELLKSIRELLERQMGTTVTDNTTVHFMQRNLPFNDAMEQRKVVEFSDEWLYNEPAFFVHPPSSKESPGLVRRPTHLSQNEFGFLATPRPVGIVVIDVPKSRYSRKRHRNLADCMMRFHSSSQLESFMQEKRLPNRAKKRFCALLSTDPKSNEVYSQTDSEIPATLDFSYRHSSYYNFFAEETSAELNTWTTELHLSFYAIRTTESRHQSTVAQSHPFIHQSLSEERNSEKLVRNVMSFRFDGDLLNRYWTCHFLDCNPQTASHITLKDKLIATLEPHGYEEMCVGKVAWQQRRVLELLLFRRIIGQMRYFTDESLRDAWINAWKKPTGSNRKVQQDIELSYSNSSDDFDYITFHAASKRCQEYQQMLHVVEDGLHESLAKVDLWLNRERVREAMRPRWAPRNESCYGKAISKLQVDNQHQIQELRRSHARISVLNATLTRQLETTRSDLDQQRADDIRRFTYVTVVFLPLGFATGLFSMSQAPASRTLIDMIVTATVALATTLLLLFSAKTMERGYNWCYRGLRGLVDPAVARVFQAMLVWIRPGRE